MLRESRRCGRWLDLVLVSVRWSSGLGGRGRGGGEGRPGRRGGGRRPGKTAPLKVMNLVGNLMTMPDFVKHRNSKDKHVQND